MISPVPPRGQLADLVALYIEHCRRIYSSHEWMNMRCALARLILSANSLQKRDIRIALDNLELEREITVTYRRQVWARWRRFLRWAVEHEHATAQLLTETAAFRPRFQVFPIDEHAVPAAPFVVDSLKRTIPFLPGLARDVVMVLASTGARPSDILRLRTCDIDIEARAAICAAHKSSYRMLPRAIPLPAPAWSVIEKRLTPFCPIDWLFPAHRDPNRCTTTNTVSQQLRRCLKRHALPTWSLYDLRRHAAQVIRAQAGLDEAQALLGHTSRATTEIYAPCRTDLARDAADLLAREVFG